ncbi:hypothetical protein DdX_04716 [Ditylenchus destructor]|uniref:Small integral membrane protein 12 n=1 Tax=Ditylenchus destructor TaxID=166010 RepID=A0AAD4ND24_9BILA|nr:hypothetical protein DdX_04716 [Ditylenchus destructor]
MWNVILQRIATKYVPYVTLPIAIAVGSIGLYLERKFSKPPKEIPYLDKGLNDQRMNRQLLDESKTDFQRNDGLLAEKRKIVPESSLTVNTGRRS